MDLTQLRKGVRIGVAATAVVLTAGISLVSASQEGSLSNTGRDSENRVELSNRHRTRVELNNTAVVANEADAQAETGDNRASNNTGDGHTESGNVHGTITNDTFVNGGSGDWELNWDDNDEDLEGNIDGTGRGSENDIVGESRTNVRVNVNNTAVVTNDTDGSVRTGDNRSNNNTGDGTAISGDAEVEVENVTDANLNAGAALEALGEGNTSSGDLSASINATGRDSSNEVDLEKSTRVRVTENNTATVTNSTNLNLKTGNNRANSNTGDGTSKSGDANFSINNETAVN